jgi:uncharacterized protein YaeQ
VVFCSAFFLSALTKPPDALSTSIFSDQEQIMAQKATIYKVELSVSDMDRHYYETHKLTVAKHPSETDERLMVRILAYALNAHEQLEFSRGLSTDDEPDLWQKNLSSEIELWVTLGLPSEKIVRQSCRKAKEVIIYSYGGRTADVWWDKIKSSTTRFENLQVLNLAEAETSELAKLENRSMKLQVNIQDSDLMVSMDDRIVYLTPIKWKSISL